MGHDRVVSHPPLRVVIADDSVLLREGLAHLIEESGGTVVARVGDGPSLVAAVVFKWFLAGRFSARRPGSP